MSDRFDYETAREELWEMGLDPDELPERNPERRDDYLRRNKLNPDRYKPDGGRGGSGGGYSSGGYGTSGTSGCFLTSACVHARNLPDDCEELKILRQFRDTYMMIAERGQAEVEEYYLVAPKIVAVVNERPDAKMIWEELFSKVITPAVTLIKGGSLEAAHKLYRESVLRLQEQYILTD